MAKSDLLKQAIADANTVRETALANAKIALQEAFAPRIQSMLSTRLGEQLEDEEEEMDAAMEKPAAPEAGAEVTGDEAMDDFPDSVNVGLDFDDDGEYDLTGMVGGSEEEEAMPAAGEEMPANPEAEYDEAGSEELDLESIIRELEGDLEEGMYEEEDEMMPEGDMHGHENDMMEEDIDEIIEAILREEDYDVEEEVDVPAGTKGTVAELEETKHELEEAYQTVKKLTNIINEVNLLNAKLLYTNKLFRNFELSENQKMKVIENFDRAGNTREVKLVFTTLAESFKRPTTKKRVVKESYASKPVATTAPSPRTISTQVLSEGFEMAERWKKLAGLL